MNDVDVASTIDALAIGMVVLGVGLIWTRSSRQAVALVALQAVLLSAVSATAAFHAETKLWHLLAGASLVLVVKAGVLPLIMNLLITRARADGVMPFALPRALAVGWAEGVGLITIYRAISGEPFKHAARGQVRTSCPQRFASHSPRRPKRWSSPSRRSSNHRLLAMRTAWPWRRHGDNTWHDACHRVLAVLLECVPPYGGVCLFPRGRIDELTHANLGTKDTPGSLCADDLARVFTRRQHCGPAGGAALVSCCPLGV